jgi:hypothetical protein
MSAAPDNDTAVRPVLAFRPDRVRGTFPGATQVSRRRGFGTRAGRAAGRSRSLPRSPRRTGGSGVALAGRATADSPPDTWHGVAAGRAAASRSRCASMPAAEMGLPERRSIPCSMPGPVHTGFPARCHAMVAAAMIAGADRHGSHSHPFGQRLTVLPAATLSP